VIKRFLKRRKQGSSDEKKDVPTNFGSHQQNPPFADNLYRVFQHLSRHRYYLMFLQGDASQWRLDAVK